MKKLSNTLWMKVILKLLILLVVAKLIGVALFFFLPHEGISNKEQLSYQAPYNHYSFKGMLELQKQTQQQSAQSQQQNGVGISITNMVLKGLYGNSDDGVIVIALKSKPKDSEVISVEESFQGYKLVSINPRSVSFEKGGMEYFLEISEAEMKNNKNYEKRTPTPIQKRDPIDYTQPLKVEKNDVNYFAKNPKEIWKQIGIREKRKGKEIIGFEVTRIAQGSIFQELGLQKGDLIIKANNKELKSYKDAIDIYQKIDTIKSVQIVFLRNNQEMEIVYEVH